MCCYDMAYGHNGKIFGTITDAKTNQPMERVTVAVEEIGVTTITNEKGIFTIEDVPVGQYHLNISSIGFQSQRMTIESKDFETTKISIALVIAKINIAEISISNNPLVNRQIVNKMNALRLPINSAQDMLKVVPGLFIAQHAGGGKAEQIFLRGFDCDHGTDIAIGVDGMPVNMVSHAHGQGYADLHFVIPETVERIEVNKGTYQASVGDFSTAGNIQFGTKKSLADNTITLEKGMYNNNRILLMTNLLPKNLSKNQNWFVATEYNYNEGFFDRSMNLNRLNIFSKYNRNLTKKTDLTLIASHFDSKWDASGQIPERSVADGSITRFGSIDPTEGGKTNRTNFSASMQHVAENNNVFKSQLFYNKYNFNLFSNFTFYKNDTLNGDMIEQKESRDIIGYNGSYTDYSQINKVKLVSTIGLQFRLDNISNSELSNVKQRATFINNISLGDIQQWSNAIYLDEQIRINKKLNLNLGLRYDNFYFNYENKLGASQQAQTKGKVSPKASLYYNPSKKTQLFVMAGRSFHSNDARVVVAQNGFQILPTAFGSEVGAIVKPNSRSVLTVSLWRLAMQQEFVYVGDEAVVEASGASLRSGIDIGLRYQIHKNLNADIDINYAKARSTEALSNENRIPLAPPLTSIGGINYTSSKGFQASLRYRYLSDRPADETNTLIAKGYTLCDAVGSYNYKHFVFGASIENIFNAKWKEAQFATETQLPNEQLPVNEIHFTSGTPFNVKLKVTYKL